MPPPLPDDGSQLHLPVQLLWGQNGGWEGHSPRGRGVGPGVPTLVSWGCTMSSKGPVMALGNLLKMRGSLGTLAPCSWQWSW